MVAVNPSCVLSSVRTASSISSGPDGLVEATVVTGVEGGWTQSQPTSWRGSARRCDSSTLEQHDEVGSGACSAQHSWCTAAGRAHASPAGRNPDSKTTAMPTKTNARLIIISTQHYHRPVDSLGLHSSRRTFEGTSTMCTTGSSVPGRVNRDRDFELFTTRCAPDSSQSARPESRGPARQRRPDR